MIPRYKDFWIGVNWGPNSLRRALKNSAPSPGKFEFANSVISMNSNSGSLGGATLFTAFRYARSGSRAVAKCPSPLPQATAISGRTHNSAPVRKRARAFNDCQEKNAISDPLLPLSPAAQLRAAPRARRIRVPTALRRTPLPIHRMLPVTIAKPLALIAYQSAGFTVTREPVTGAWAARRRRYRRGECRRPASATPPLSHCEYSRMVRSLRLAAPSPPHDQLSPSH